MADNVQAIEDLLGGLGEISKISVDFGKFMTDSIRTEVLARLATTGPKMRSGALRESINVVYRPDTNFVEISMEVYGIFQNFGVRGTLKDPGAIDVPREFLVRPLNGNRYAFKSKTIGGTLPYGVRKSIAQYGLKPRPFIPTKDEIDSLIEEFIKQQKTLTTPKKR